MTVPGTMLPVLMALRVKGRAGASSVATAAGVTVDAAEAALALAAARGVAERREEGDLFALTPAGRAELTRLLAAEEIDRAVLAAGYDEFFAFDADLKRRLSAWQLRPPDARDPARTGAALASVRAAAGGAQVVTERLVTIVPRLAPYAHRLAAALRQLAAGDERFVASPRVESLHQVWFELHEDLLVTLGRERHS